MVLFRMIRFGNEEEGDFGWRLGEISSSPSVCLI